MPEANPLSRPANPHQVRQVVRRILCVLAPVMYVHGQPAHAGCAPAATGGNDTILCTAATPVPLDAGAGNDSVTNDGDVTASESDTQSSPPEPPDFDEFESGEADTTVDATSTAIRGGAGNDTILNNGSASSDAEAALQSTSIPLTLAGGQDVSATLTIEATATGLAGDAGVNRVDSGGTVQATTDARLSGANVELNAADATHGDTTTTVRAVAVGIDSGAQARNAATNSGQVSATAATRSQVTNVEVNLADAATADSQLVVDATASAMRAGAGTLTNDGTLTVRADADSLDVSVNMSYLDITLTDPSPANAGTTVVATGTGLDGTVAEATLNLANTGSIDVRTDARLNALAVALASEGTPAGLSPVVNELMGDAPIAEIGIRSDSHAAGITGGSGADRADNSGAILIGAQAGAQQASINVGVALIDWKIPTPGIVIGSAGTRATADGIGIDGGAGNDRVGNEDLIIVGSDANAGAVTVSANISGFTDTAPGVPSPSLAISVAVADTKTLAQADSIGLRGGAGDDTVTNDGGILVDAGALGAAVSGAATLNVEFDASDTQLGANAVAARAGSFAEATAIGIDGGAANYRQGDVFRQAIALGSDNDVIRNSGTINANAESDVLAVTASVVVGGTVKGAGAVFNVAAADASATSHSTAIGVDAGTGNDQVVNTETIVANADSEALSVGVALGVTMANQGAAVGVTLARSEAEAQAVATGVQGGNGLDGLTNEGSVVARADADAQAVSVSVSLSGAMDGVAVSGALTDSSGDAIAAASGMDGGADDDIVRNTGIIDVAQVNALARSAGIGVAAAGTNNGVSVSASLAQTSANSTASAIGLDGGEGNDQITNAGSIVLRNIDASTDAVAVAVSMSGNFTAGVSLAASMTDSSATSVVRAAGIAGGAGDDILFNSGTITANNDIGADAVANAISVSLSASFTGGALGAAVSDASARADTRLAGMDAGDGMDYIDNRGAITLSGDSESGATSVSVNVSGSMGVGGGAELVNAESEASTTVTGIDAGDGINSILNSATVDIESRSEADALGVGVGATFALGGNATLVDASASSMATAIGIGEGGSAAGPSGITNSGRLDVLADADVAGKAISANLGGYALGETSITAMADGYGIRGGDGMTQIDNRGVIDVLSQARAEGLAVAASGFGRVVGDAHATADAHATGIAAGDGDDLVNNYEAINLDAISNARAVTLALTLIGSIQADARSDALTSTTALDGGAGNDVLRNSAVIDVNSASTTSANGLSISLFGAGGMDVLNAPTARATAMNGGAGNDTVVLGGTRAGVIATATADIQQSSWNLAGVTGSRAGAEATATASALEGGAGNDVLFQRSGLLSVQSSARATADSTSWTLAGDTGTEAALVAAARATGLDGGEGDDYLRNETAFSAGAYAILEADGGGNAIFGRASTHTDIGATATTVGMGGGDGNDDMGNTATLTLVAQSIVNSDRASYTFAGGAAIDEILKSRAELVGLSGGAGNDRIANTAQIGATAAAFATTLGGASTGLGGGTDAAGRAQAEVVATGIAGGGGDDIIDNSGRLHIAATLSPVANNGTDSGTFFGNASVDARVNGDVDAAGIDGGDGNDRITNSAEITVLPSTTLIAQSYSSADGSEFSFGTAGNGVSHSEILIEGRGGGIRAGQGDDVVINSGNIAVQMQFLAARGETHASSGDTSGYGLGNINATVRGWGNGIDLGHGTNRLENTGDIAVNVSNYSWGLSGVGAVSFFNGHSTINSTALGEGRGVVAGDGAHTILNSGDIRIVASPIAESRASVDSGNDSGNAVGTANNIATGRGWAIETGNGNTRIENSGLLSVTAAPQARAPDNHFNQNIYAYGDHPDLDTTNGDAEAYVRSVATGEAHGIRVGVGEHTISNSGTIEVSANAFAEGGYDVNPGNGPAGHAHTETRAHALGTATGIGLGGGNATILNTGTITATALPVASMAYQGGDGGPFVFLESSGRATGISGGSSAGVQSLTNEGIISALAGGSVLGVDNGSLLNTTPLRLAGVPTAVAVEMRSAGYKSVVNNGEITATASFVSPNFFFQPGTAYGLWINGDGVAVTNNGLIAAQGFWYAGDFNSAQAIHMSSRAGQDLTLSLGRESVTRGHVTMTGGRSTLVLEGNPLLNGDLRVDAGREFNLVLNNDGFFGHVLPTVTGVTKNGAGIYALPTLNSVSSMTLNDGTLQLASGYVFSPTGTLQAGIHADGGYGGLVSTGTVSLDGALQVVGDAGLYVDGTRYRIISAGTLASAGGFDAVELPQASALVSFATERSSTAFDVVVDVASFESAAQGHSLQAIARSLDRAVADASEEMRQGLALLQRLDAGELTRSYRSLNPVAYEFLTSATAGNVNQYADALWQRMSDPETGVQASAMRSADGGRALRRMSATRDGRVERELGVWMRVFGREGDDRATEADAEYEYEQGGLALGYDRYFGRLAVGASLGFVNNRLDSGDETGRSRVDSTLYSLYGGYGDGRLFVDAVLAYGRNDYHLDRQVVIGQFISDTSGSFAGKALTAGISGGRTFPTGNWSYGPTASLQYIRLSEPAFNEEGGPFALNLQSRASGTLAGSLGANLGRSFAVGNAEWFPELSLAWRHERALGERARSASFAGAPDAMFSIVERPGTRDGALAGAAVTYSSGGFAARLSWRGEFGSNSTSHGLFAGVRYML